MRFRRLTLMLTALVLAGCNRPPARQAAASLTVTDDAGRTVSLAAPARRVVSLTPSSTELLFALGAGDRVVGRTTWCKYPAEAVRVPAVGDGMSPNVEAVIARNPDLVVLYRSALNVTATEQLERLGTASVVLAQDRLTDLARDARLLGQLVGRERAGDSLAGALERLAATPPPPPTTSIAFIVWDNPATVIGAGSFLDELARLAGARNVFADITTPSATVSIETIAARDPDAIVQLADDSITSDIPGYAARREWQAIRAVRERRFIRLPGDLFGRPSPRAAEAVQVFRQLLERAAR